MWATHACLPCLVQVLGQLSAIQQQLQEVASAASGKLDLAAAKGLELRLEAVERSAERSSEGVRQLTSSTYKRVDEHASAIQRLTLVRAVLWCSLVLWCASLWYAWCSGALWYSGAPQSGMCATCYEMALR